MTVTLYRLEGCPPCEVDDDDRCATLAESENVLGFLRSRLAG